MTIDGMWALFIPVAGKPGEADASMLILTNGRVYHGDSIYAGIGSYEVDDGQITARVEAAAYNHTHGVTWNSFGTLIEPDSASLIYRFEGTIETIEKITGRYWQMHDPSEMKDVVLQKLHDFMPSPPAAGVPAPPRRG